MRHGPSSIASRHYLHRLRARAEHLDVHDDRCCYPVTGRLAGSGRGLPDGGHVSEVLERPVKGRHRADGRTGTGRCRRLRLVHVMPVLGAVPVVPEPIGATAATAGRPVAIGLRERFLIEVRQVGVLFICVSAHAAYL